MTLRQSAKQKFNSLNPSSFTKISYLENEPGRSIKINNEIIFFCCCGCYGLSNEPWRLYEGMTV